MKAIKLIFFTLSALVLSSCVVSKQKYDIAEAGRLAAIYSRDSLADMLSASRADYAALSRERDNLRDDTLDIGIASEAIVDAADGSCDVERIGC